MGLSQNNHKFILLIFFITVVVVILTVGVPLTIEDGEYLVKKMSIVDIGQIDVKPTYVPPQKLINPPEIIRAIYVTSYSASSSKYLNYLKYIFENTEINAVVVDIKPSSGYVSYNSSAPEVIKYSSSNNLIKNINEFVEFFHKQNIYLIGRIAVFEDPVYAIARPELAIYNSLTTTENQKVLWGDNNGLFWLDPTSKDVWDYNISIAKDALYHGFDEINFDYIRFPSDGNMKVIEYPLYDKTRSKSDIIGEFFMYLRNQLKGEKISADLFGQTTIDKDDMGIGQLIETAFETFDFLAPMVYPSHYANGFLGFENPADYPYEIVRYSMESGLAREKAYQKTKNQQGKEITESLKDITDEVTELPDNDVDISLLAKFRPWLQDFDINADYTADMIGAEIKAVKDALEDHYSGFMLWSPTNIYTIGAILKTE